jgi:DNA-binding transcriptional LysR family regulator
MLDPRRLLTFREVARRASFSRAAEALALTQPAVSQQVAALEREVGAPLLHRRPGGPTLTETGDLLLAHADALAARLAAADEQLGELRAERDVRLRVGAFPSALATIVPAAIAARRAAEPDVAFEAGEGSSADVAAGVRDGRLHVGVCFEDAAAPPHEHPDVQRHEIGLEPMDAAVGPGHPLAKRRRIKLDALSGDIWTAPSPDHLVYRACVAAGFEPRIDYLTRDPMAIRGLVAAGLAVTLTPRLLAGQLHGIRTIRLTGEAPSRRLYALTPAVGARPRARAFVDALRAAAKERTR